MFYRIAFDRTVSSFVVTDEVCKDSIISAKRLCDDRWSFHAVINGTVKAGVLDESELYYELRSYMWAPVLKSVVKDGNVLTKDRELNQFVA